MITWVSVGKINTTKQSNIARAPNIQLCHAFFLLQEASNGFRVKNWAKIEGFSEKKDKIQYLEVSVETFRIEDFEALISLKLAVYDA